MGFYWQNIGHMHINIMIPTFLSILKSYPTTTPNPSINHSCKTRYEMVFSYPDPGLIDGVRSRFNKNGLRWWKKVPVKLKDIHT